MNQEQLAERVEVIDRRAEIDDQLADSVDERTHRFGDLFDAEIGEKAVEAATEAVAYADALMKARPKKTLGKVSTTESWGTAITKDRYIRLGELGTYHLHRDDDEGRYWLTRIAPEANTKDDRAHQAFEYDTVDKLATVPTDPELASVVSKRRDIGHLLEAAETLGTICEAAGVKVETPAPAAA